MKRAIVFVLAAVSLAVAGCSSAGETDAVKPGATAPPASAKPGSQNTKTGTMEAKPLLGADEAAERGWGPAGVCSGNGGANPADGAPSDGRER